MLETQVLCGKLVMENLATIDRKIPTVSDRTTAVAAALVSAPGDDRLPMATVGMVCVCLPVGFACCIYKSFLFRRSLSSFLLGTLHAIMRQKGHLVHT